MSIKLKQLMVSISVIVVAAFLFTSLDISGVSALDPGAAAQNGVQSAGGGSGGQGQLNGAIRTVINVLLFLLGALAVIMIVIGGIRYTLSNGEANQITAAKNTVLYAVIGLVVALLAYAIVNFVIGAF